jgi:hypothetical protein
MMFWTFSFAGDACFLKVLKQDYLDHIVEQVYRISPKKRRSIWDDGGNTQGRQTAQIDGTSALISRYDMIAGTGRSRAIGNFTISANSSQKNLRLYEIIYIIPAGPRPIGHNSMPMLRSLHSLTLSIGLSSLYNRSSSIYTCDQFCKVSPYRPDLSGRYCFLYAKKL